MLSQDWLIGFIIVILVIKYFEKCKLHLQLKFQNLSTQSYFIAILEIRKKNNYISF